MDFPMEGKVCFVFLLENDLQFNFAYLRQKG